MGMRKENYLIGLLNRDIIRLQLKLPFASSPIYMLPKSLEWNLYVCILDFMFDDKFKIKTSFKEDVAALKRRLLLCGAINFLLSPFVLIIMTIFFFLSHAEEFPRHPSSIGTRQFSSYARWKFREFNELPHVFEQRINSSYDMAYKYVDQFPSHFLSIIARFIAFIFGAFAAALIMVSLLNEEVLLHVKIPSTPDQDGFNLLWYVAICSTILAVSRSFVIETNTVFEPNKIM